MPQENRYGSSECACDGAVITSNHWPFPGDAPRNSGSFDRRVTVSPAFTPVVSFSPPQLLKAPHVQHLVADCVEATMCIVKGSESKQDLAETRNPNMNQH